MKFLQLSGAPIVAKGERLVAADELKGMAIGFVILFHAAGVFNGSNWYHAEIGVDIFLMVSGFILTVNCAEMSTKEFLKRRFLRIYPSYWIALALFLYLGRKYYGAVPTTSDVLLHIVGLHGYGLPVQFMSINNSFWFITLIVTLYIAFLFLRKRLHDVTLITGVAASLTAVVWLAYQVSGHGGGQGHLAARIPDMFIGMIAGQAARGGKLEIKNTPWFALSLLGLAYAGYIRGIVVFYWLPSVAIIATYLVIRKWMRLAAIGRVTLMVLPFFGVYSYEIYLLHQPLMRDYSRLFLLRGLKIEEPTDFQMFVAMMSGLGLAIISGYFLNKATSLLFPRRKAVEKTVGRIGTPVSTIS